jgi:hypothetical protein
MRRLYAGHASARLIGKGGNDALRPANLEASRHVSSYSNSPMRLDPVGAHARTDSANVIHGELDATQPCVSTGASTGPT